MFSQLALQQLMARRRSGQLTRRAFLRRVEALGLTGTLAVMLLESCEAPVPPKSTHGKTTITWQLSDNAANDTYNYLITKFHELYPDIQVNSLPSTSMQYNTHDDLTNKLAQCQKSPDVLSLDVIWISEFASRGWITPLEHFWPESQQQQYLPIPLAVVKSEKHTWAAPFHTDVGVMFYRTDLPNLPDDFSSPQDWTWTRFEEIATHAMIDNNIAWGYVWQGNNNEGLVCNFIEVLSSYQANFFDHAQKPTQATIYTPAAKEALDHMINWVGAISPPNVTTDNEDESSSQWQRGTAAFMRNWPGEIITSNNPDVSKVAHHFGIAPLPSGARSCLGGWQLAINAFSDHKEEAWTFIQWMLGEDVQRYLAIKEGFPVTLSSIYDDTSINAWNPFLPKIKSLLQNAQPRPVSPCYPAMTNAIASHINRALRKQETSDLALQKLQIELEGILRQCTRKSVNAGSCS